MSPQLGISQPPQTPPAPPKDSGLVFTLGFLGWVMIGISALVLVFELLAQESTPFELAIAGLSSGLLLITLAAILRALERIEDHLRTWRYPR